MNKGLSVIEVIIAAALFVIFAGGIGGVVVAGLSGNRLGDEQTTASNFASEGIEAVRSIKNQSYSSLASNSCSTGTGLAKTTGVWSLSGLNNQYGVNNKFIRVINVCDVARDVGGNIVSSGGTNDPDTKKATSTVSWNFTAGRANSVVLSEYFTNWKAVISGGTGGILVYGNGGTTTDAMQYRLYNSDNTWGTASAMADIDGATTNKYLRAVRVYSSPTRSEKIAISRHYNGSNQFIYGQVFNGSTWSSVLQLSTWAATTYLDAQNFDGTYLANGDFMVVYSDNTTTPKMRTWNGSSWSGTAVSLRALTGNPVWITTKVRLGTNEVMFAALTSSSRSSTQYFNGGVYQTSNWSAVTNHATATVTATKKIIDFLWSLNSPTKGAIIYASSTTDKNIDMKVWTANGTGGGAWGTAASSASQTSNLGALNLAVRPGANEFQVCDKDANTTPRIICYKATFSGSAITWTTPTNSTIAAATDTGIQRSYNLEFENATGSTGIVVYSDNTAAPKFKLYNAGTSTWDAAATTIAVSPYTLGNPVRSVRLKPLQESDDILVLMTDNNLDLYSVIWDGTNNVMYTNPAAKAFSQHGTSGSVSTNYWYDFTWD